MLYLTAGTTLGITKAESLAYDHRLNADAKDALSWLLAWFYQMGLLPSHFEPHFHTCFKSRENILGYHSQVGLFRVVLGNKQKFSLNQGLFVLAFCFKLFN